MTHAEIPLTQSINTEPLAHCDVHTAQAEMKGSDAWRKGHRASMPLITTPALRVVLMGLRAGVGLAAHRADGPMTVQVLEGRMTFRALDRSHDLRQGQLLTLEEGVAHGVDALEDTVFLLTVAVGKIR